MKLKMTLINLLQLVGFALVGFVVLLVNKNNNITVTNGLNTMYIGLGFGALLLILTYLTTNDSLSGLINSVGTFLILLVGLILALVDVNYLYGLVAMGGITVIYAIVLVSLVFSKKE